jgi:hypothetical protein
MTPSRVEKVIDCSLTGQRLGVIIHNDLNSPIYLYWITETGTFKYRLHREVVLSRRRLAAFCNELNIPGVVGLAVFLVRGITYDADHRIEPCIFLQKATWGNRTVWKNYCRKYLKAGNISSSTVIS